MATTLFATFGAAGTGALRFLSAAVVLLAATRPRVTGHDRGWWLAIGGFGASMAAANLFLFQALDRIPLGTAVTLQFLGPLTLAVLGARRRLEVGCACAAAAGVVLLTGGPAGASPAGIAFALGAAVAVAGSIVAGEAVGRRTQRLDGLALSVAVAALLTAPAGGPALLDTPGAGVLVTVAMVGVLGIAVPYTLFLTALRRVGARTYSVLISLDPAVALLFGWLLLGHGPSFGELAGIGLVVAASAVAVGTPSPGTAAPRRRDAAD